MRPAPDVEVKSLPCRIERMDRVADDVMAVFLRLPAVEEFHYRPGQYLDVMLSEGRRRSFSIASAPGDGRLIELHVRRASKSGFTGPAVRQHARRHAAAHRGSARAVLAAHGIAAAAAHGRRRHGLRAVAGDAAAAGREPATGARCTLYWGGRDLPDLYEHDWLQRLAARAARVPLSPGAVGPAGGDDAPWTGRRGLVHEAVLADHPDLVRLRRLRERPAGDDRGDPRASSREHGLPREQLFFDSFDYAPDTLAKLQARRAR